MWENTRQVRQVTLIDGKETLSADSLRETVVDALIEVSVLVVHSGHDSICVCQQESLHNGGFSSITYLVDALHSIRQIHSLCYSRDAERVPLPCQNVSLTSASRRSTSAAAPSCQNPSSPSQRPRRGISPSTPRCHRCS